MRKLLFVIFATSLFYACNNTEPKHEAKENDKLKIISLAPSVTKEILSLGLADQIVGATSYCSISSEKEELIIGTATDVNLEKILILKPDIVFASSLTKPNSIEALTNNGIKVHHVAKTHSYEEICEQFLELGKLTETEELANEIIKQSRQKVDSLKKLVPQQEKKQKVFFQIGAKPLFSVIPNTFMNDYITFSGCENIAHDFDQGTISRESVLQRNPDVIFIVTMGGLGEEEKKQWESYSELNAVKNQKIFIIDADMSCSPTVLTFTQSLEEVIGKIYHSK